MIESKYIEGVLVPEFDSEVSRKLQSYEIEGGGNLMKIAIENFDGNAYRLISTWGLGPYFHVVQSLHELGLRDSLDGKFESRNGTDAWFVPSADMAQPVHEPFSEPLPLDQASDILGKLEALQELPETERKSVILSRVGQGEFRSKLIDYWKGCAVTGAACIPLLKASHIKPWRDSSNRERLDVFNGLLLSPNLDAAFDAGFITFDPAGRILMSHDIGAGTAYQLHISPKSRIAPKLLANQHQAYLAHHREAVFRQ